MCYTKIGDSRKKCFISKPVSVFHLSRTLIIKWCKKKPISKCTKIYGILRSFKNAVILRLRLLSGHVIRSMKKNHLSYANKILSVIFVSFLVYLFLGKNNLWPFKREKKGSQLSHENSLQRRFLLKSVYDSCDKFLSLKLTQGRFFIEENNEECIYQRNWLLV